MAHRGAATIRHCGSLAQSVAAPLAVANQGERSQQNKKNRSALGTLMHETPAGIGGCHNAVVAQERQCKQQLFQTVATLGAARQ